MKKAELAALICDLSTRDRAIYGALAEAAKHRHPCPTANDLLDISGGTSVSGTVDAIHRLEQRGLIEVRRFQRSRQVRIVETDEWTALPLNTAPHWRDRPREVPAPTPAVVQSRQPALADEIMRWASRRGIPLADALADLVFVGWKVEMERG